MYVTFCTTHLHAAARKALYALKRRCIELHITDVRLQCSLFDTLVKPVLSYGCEVWAVETQHIQLKQLEKLHVEFLRSILGVAKHGIPTRIVLAEFGRYPLRIFWWKQILSYRNRFMELPRHRLLSRAYQVNKYILTKSWSSHVRTWLNERARQHTAIFDITSDGRLYSSQIDIPKMMLRCKAEYEVNFRTHTGTRDTGILFV